MGHWGCCLLVDRCEYWSLQVGCSEGRTQSAFGGFYHLDGTPAKSIGASLHQSRHRALVVDEILREVTAWVARIHPPAAVALPCCAELFEEPALSVLWKIQDKLLTLIKTLPPDSWELQPMKIGESEEKIVCGSPQLREYFALFKDYQLRRDCDVCGTDAHPNPVER